MWRWRCLTVRCGQPRLGHESCLLMPFVLCLESGSCVLLVPPQGLELCVWHVMGLHNAEVFVCDVLQKHCRLRNMSQERLNWNLEDWSTWSVEKAALLKAFVDMVMGSEGQGMLSDFSFTVVPAAMNTWATVWTNTIDKPAGFTAMTFEPDTQRWTGQGQNVVSSKRNSYSLWKLDDLESAATAMKLVVSLRPLPLPKTKAVSSLRVSWGI